MFPHISFLGLGLYYWMILIGVIAAIISFRILSFKINLSSKLYNFTLISAFFAIVIGYLSSVLFEDFYEFIETGEWNFGSGSTFYGGVIGGLFFFHLIYFLLGKKIFKEGENIKGYKDLISLIVISIVLAHAFGRIGCLFDGCCYGIKTDAWYGIGMHINGVLEKRVPTQLIESIFLFLLYGFLVFLLLKLNLRTIPSFYMVLYGVFRFLIEFIRDDDRGSLGISFLSPSQVIALLLIIAGVIIFILEYKKKKVKIADEKE